VLYALYQWGQKCSKQAILFAFYRFAFTVVFNLTGPNVIKRSSAMIMPFVRVGSYSSKQLPCMAVGRATAQAVGCLPLTTEVSLQTQATPREIYGGQNEAETGISLRTLVFLRNYQSTIAPGY
jgi:hypothetical protein